jgi:hypothetical protein
MAMKGAGAEFFVCAGIATVAHKITGLWGLVALLTLDWMLTHRR